MMRKRHIFCKEIKEQLSDLQELDNWHGIIAVLYDYLIIIFAIYLSFISKWFYPISVLIIGSYQRSLSTILHEASHKCLTKSKPLEKMLGTYFSGYLVFQEFSLYRDTHIKKHHAFLGDKCLDPDFEYHIKEKLYMSQNRTQFLWSSVLAPLLLLKAPSFLYYLFVNRLKPTMAYWKNFLKMYAYWAVIFATCLYFGITLELVLFWFVPFLTAFLIVGWFNELSEHYPLLWTDDIDIYMSRNRFSHWIEHFFLNTHNENYHLTHHLRPKIPFWNLKKAHEIMCKDQSYADANKQFGGIFLSSNENPSLIQQLSRKMVFQYD